MFNKQLGKAMQHVLSAEINIKRSVDDLKSKIDVLPIDNINIDDMLAAFNLRESDHNLLNSCMVHVNNYSVTKNIILSEDRNTTIRVSKAKIKVSIRHKIDKLLDINGEWTYDGTSLTITLTEATLETIIGLIGV